MRPAPSPGISAALNFYEFAQYKMKLKYTIHGKHFAGKMWASADMVMMNAKGLQ